MPKVSFGLTEPEPEPENPSQAKKVTAEKNVVYGPKNVHPDKGTYLKVPLTAIVLDGNAYLGVASTGGMGLINIKFDFPINFGNGEEIVTYHSGWGNILSQRDAAYIAAHGLVGKRSGIKVWEMPDYTVDGKGVSNITELLGPLKPPQSKTS